MNDNFQNDINNDQALHNDSLDAPILQPDQDNTSSTYKYLPNQHTKKRWYVQFALFIIIITFVSGITFGAGYMTALVYGDRFMADVDGTTSLASTNNGSDNDSGINVTQIQAIATTNTNASTIPTIAQEVNPAIVTVANYSYNSYMNSSDFYDSTGSGIIFKIDSDSLFVVTNYHVIEDGAEIKIIFHDNTTVTAVPVGFDSRMDIAILSIPLEDLESDIDTIVIATLGDSDLIQVGDLAVAIGNPLGPEFSSTVTSGIISAIGRDINIDEYTTQKNLIQTDAAINPGNSGGALLNEKGEVIGINSAKFVDESVEGIGFAIPINDVLVTIDEIFESSSGEDIAYNLSEDRAFLGVQISEITSEIYRETGIRFGVYITGVFPFSGAEEAGIQAEDIIYSIDDVVVKNVQDLFDILEDSTVNDSIDIGLIRDGNIINVNVTLYSYKDVMDKQ